MVKELLVSKSFLMQLHYRLHVMDQRVHAHYYDVRRELLILGVRYQCEFLCKCDSHSSCDIGLSWVISSLEM